MSENFERMHLPKSTVATSTPFFLRNVGNRSPSDAAPYPRRTEPPTVPLCEPLQSRIHFRVLYASQPEERLFPYTEFTDWFRNGEEVCSLRGKN
jgi:hypothetical protein